MIDNNEHVTHKQDRIAQRILRLSKANLEFGNVVKCPLMDPKVDTPIHIHILGQTPSLPLNINAKKIWVP